MPVPHHTVIETGIWSARRICFHANSGADVADVGIGGTVPTTDGK